MGFVKEEWDWDAYGLGFRFQTADMLQFELAELLGFKKEIIGRVYARFQLA